MFAFSDTRRNVTHFVGETVHLQCGDEKTLNGPANWMYSSPLDADIHLIIYSGYLVSDNRGDRLSVSGNTLIISIVQINDSGVYMCYEQSTETKRPPQHRVVLTVLGKFCE